LQAKHRLALIGVEQQVGRELRDEPVERDRLDHAVTRERHPGEQRCDGHGAIGHRRAIGDVTRHLDGGSVRPGQKLASREAARILAHRDRYRRLVGPRDTGQQQETDQDQSAHDVSLTH
jgi:hypothetical protein